MERNSNPIIDDIKDVRTFHETLDRIDEIRNSCKGVLMIIDNKAVHKLTKNELAEIRQLITDAHWNINNAYKPLHEISKGRM